MRRYETLIFLNIVFFRSLKKPIKPVIFTRSSRNGKSTHIKTKINEKTLQAFEIKI